MKYCKNCGSPMSDDANFCTKCGTNSNGGQKESENIQFNATAESKEKSTAEQSFGAQAVAQQGMYENPKALKPKPKKKIIISAALLLLLCIVVGTVFVYTLFSSGAPKVINADDQSFYDITFDDFKNGIIKNTNLLSKSYADCLWDGDKSDVDRYIDDLNNDNNWTSWTNDNGNMIYKWKHKTYDDSDFTETLSVVVDSESNKITGITVTSYYPIITTKSIVMSYILFGNNINDQNVETLLNLTMLCYNVYNQYPVMRIGDKVIGMVNESSDVSYLFLPYDENADLTYNFKFDEEKLYRFDTILSIRYNYDYDWMTIDDFKKSKGK